MTQLIASLLSSLLLLPALAHAEGADTATPAPVAKLAKLVGEWKGTGTVTLGGKSHPITGTWVCKGGAGGSGVRCALSAKGIPGLPSYEELDLFGYDPGDRLVHWYSVTNAGETHDHKGSWTGDRLTVQHTGPSADGKLYSERSQLAFGADGSMRLLCTVKVGEETTARFDVAMTR